MITEKCFSCKYRIECEKKYGKIGIDEEDCRQIEGTHFCKLTWEQLIQKDGEK